MNYRQEIDALGPSPTLSQYANGKDWAGAAYSHAMRRLALAARIHAEPHTLYCGIWLRSPCTCGKDAAMREVLG